MSSVFDRTLVIILEGEVDGSTAESGDDDDISIMRCALRRQPQVECMQHASVYVSICLYPSGNGMNKDWSTIPRLPYQGENRLKG